MGTINFDDIENLSKWTDKEKVDFYEWILEKAPATIYLNNFDAQYTVWASPHFEKITGHTVQSMVELGPLNFFKMYYHPDDYEIITKGLEYLINNDKPGSCVYRIKDDKNNWHWYYTVGQTAKRHSNNSPHLAINVGIDLNEEVLSEKQFNSIIRENAQLKYQIQINQLTKREKEIAVHIAKGYAIKEIACLLHISYHTADTHKKNIQRKLGLKNSAAIACFASMSGLL